MVYADAWQITAEDRVALLGSLASGQGHSVTFATLLTGATLLPFPAINRGVTGLRDWMIANEITAYISSASVFRNFMKTLDHDAHFPRVHAVQTHVGSRNIG